MNAHKRARTVERTSERGAILPIMALLLVALLTMAAIAVDLGGARETRRRNQGLVDAAVVGAAQDLPTTNKALDTAISLVATNLGISVAQARVALDSCTGGAADPSPLTVKATVATAGRDEHCVSFDNSASRIRVYYRDSYKTAFGSVVNVKSLSINNSATAGTLPRGIGGILPFGLAGSGSGQACIKTSSGGTATPPCGGSTTGNYGFLNVSQYGNATFGTSYLCGVSHDPRFRDNLAMGIDHDLVGYGQTSPPYQDIQDAEVASCPAIPSAGPDHVDVETGNVDPILTAPLLTDPPGSSSIITDTNGARLQRGAFVCKSTKTNIWSEWPTPYDCGAIHGSYVDDVPLWHFIGNSTVYPNTDHSLTGDVPNACQYSLFQTQLSNDSGPSTSVTTRASDMRTLLDNCFHEYAYGEIPPVPPLTSGTPCTSSSPLCVHAPGCAAIPCTAIVFGYKTIDSSKLGPFDIQATPRFGYAPIVCALSQITVGSAPPTTCTTPFGSGTASVFITRFAPVFIQRLINTAGGSSPNLDFEPGVHYTGGTGSIDEILGYTFAGTMLPGGLGDPNAPNLTDVNRAIRLIQ